MLKKAANDTKYWPVYFTNLAKFQLGLIPIFLSYLTGYFLVNYIFFMGIYYFSIANINSKACVHFLLSVYHFQILLINPEMVYLHFGRLKYFVLPLFWLQKNKSINLLALK